MMTAKATTINRIVLGLSLILLVSTPALVEAQVDTGREDQLLKTAMNYIETNRKGTTEIRLVDNVTGSPVSGAKVEYHQISHDFIFGSFVLESGTPDMVTSLGLEWSGDVGLNWAQIEPSHGVFNFRGTDGDVARLLQNGLRLLGHFHGLLLDWNSQGWAPPQPPSYSGFDRINDPAFFDQYKQSLYEFIFQVASHYKGKLSAYMTQLEVNWPSVVIRTGLAKTPVWTVQQAVEVEKVVTRAIRDADPNAIVILATSTIEPVDARHSHLPGTDLTPIDFTRLCIKSGVDFDMVALEVYPMDGSPASYYDYVKNLAALGKPVFINESGYPSSRPDDWIRSQPDPQAAADWVMSWKWHVFDEHTQALWFKYLFTLLFGLKGVAGVDLWLVKDLEDGVAGVLLFKNMGVYDVNGSPKESALLLKRLVINFTTYGTTATNAEGQVTLAGFAGNYEVNVEEHQPFVVHVSEGPRTNSTIALVQKKTQVSTTTSSTNPSTTISQATILSQAPTQLYLVILMGSIVVFAAVTMYLVRKMQHRRNS